MTNKIIEQIIECVAFVCRVHCLSLGRFRMGFSVLYLTMNVAFLCSKVLMRQRALHSNFYIFFVIAVAYFWY